jgi:hypothetical protein
MPPEYAGERKLWSHACDLPKPLICPVVLPIARIPTGPIARTSVFVPEWHRLYVAVPRDKERGAELRVFEVVP